MYNQHKQKGILCLMEIERKYLINSLPNNIEDYTQLKIVQAYLNTSPVIRIRKQNNDYILTYKGEGMIAREEHNLPLNASSFEHLLTKADGNVISKTRYLIPLPSPCYKTSVEQAMVFSQNLTIELDLFDAPFSPLILAEVEFQSLEEANAFIPPDWFGDDVSLNKNYHNSTMSRKIF